MKKAAVIAAIIAILTALSGCSVNSEDLSTQREASAEKIIEAMFTGPNEELCNMDTFARIGEGVEESAELSAEMEVVVENWRETAGAYFAEGVLEEFVEQGAARQFLSESCITEEKMAVQHIEKKQEEESTEVYAVDWKMGEDERRSDIFFRYDKEGLIEEVKILP